MPFQDRVGGSCGLDAGEAQWCRGLTLSDPEKYTPRVLRKEAGQPSEKLESPAVPSTGSGRSELWYIHSGDSYPAAQKEEIVRLAQRLPAAQKAAD